MDNGTKSFETLLCECNGVQSSRSRHSNQFESHQKKLLNNSKCRLQFLQIKWIEQQDDDSVDLALSYDRIPTSTGHRTIWHLQVFALGKTLCEKRFVFLGIAHIAFEPPHPLCYIQALYGTPGVMNN